MSRRDPRRCGPVGGRAASSLAEVWPGCEARIAELGGLRESQRERLLAYGVIPGRWVRVIQHSPVTVLMVEHTELAIEADVAAGVKVEKVRLSPGDWHRRPKWGRGPRGRGRRGGWRRRKPPEDQDPS